MANYAPRRTPRPPVKSPPAPTRARQPAAKPATKLDALVTALRAPKGATISDLMNLTNWQAHSVRGALAGALKARGHAITSTKAGAERVYRIAGKA